MKQTGITTDAKPVFSCYDMVGTHGLPMEIVFDLCRQKGLVIDWMAFWNDGLREGRNPDAFLHQITEALKDVYGNVYAEEVIKRLMFCWVELSK